MHRYKNGTRCQVANLSCSRILHSWKSKNYGILFTIMPLVLQKLTFFWSTEAVSKLKRLIWRLVAKICSPLVVMSILSAIFSLNSSICLYSFLPPIIFCPKFKSLYYFNAFPSQTAEISCTLELSHLLHK